MRSSSRSQCDTEADKIDEHEKSGAEDSQESASENEGDNNNNEDDEREEGEICEEDRDSSKINVVEKSKMYKKKKRRRRKRELTLKSDQSQQIEDDDDEMSTIKESSLGDDNDGNLSDSYVNRKHSVSTRRRHSSSSDPVNLSIGNKQQAQIDHDDSDEGNIDVETVSAPSKVRKIFNFFFVHKLIFFSSSFYL